MRVRGAKDPSEKQREAERQQETSKGIEYFFLKVGDLLDIGNWRLNPLTGGGGHGLVRRVFSGGTQVRRV